MFVEVNSLDGLILSLQPPKKWEPVLAAVKSLPAVIYTTQAVGAQTVPSNIIVRTSHPSHRDEAFPVRAAIKEGLELLNMQPHQVAYVTDDESHISRAIPTHVGTVLVSSQVTYRQPYPDFMLDDYSDLPEILADELGGYFGELQSAIYSFDHRIAQAGVFVRVKRDLLEELDVAIQTTGRYIPNDEYRNYKHVLTHWVHRSKRRDCGVQFIERFVRLARPLLEQMIDQFGANLVTRIPPRPGEWDRMKQYLNELCRGTDASPAPHLLKSIRSWDRQVGLTAKEREENVRGVFKASCPLPNEHVILFDDVITTGATAAEAARTLLDAGCTRVSVLAVAASDGVRSYGFYSEPRLACPGPGCDGELVLRIGKGKGYGFWSCNNWPRTGCPEKINDGLKGLRKANLLCKTSDIVDDIDISF